MPSEFSVGEDVKELLEEIISKNNLKDISDIKYKAGSLAGDGYASKTVAVEVINGNGSFRLFFKCALNVKSTDTVPIEKLYETEIYFYDVVFPAYLKFLEERDARAGFRSVPKCYGTSVKNKILALENLKDKGFTLHDRRKVMNDRNVEFVLKTFAKFHAVSFSFKDQETEVYRKLLDNASGDVFSKMMEVEGVTKVMSEGIKCFIDKLDPIEDKYILDNSSQLDEKLILAVSSPRRSVNEFSILTQGDCWCNNMMFLYDEENKDSPDDIMLIDWQLVRQASPVFDISYFFYPIASTEALDKLDYYLAMYHEELSKYIKLLGSDPEVLYPFRIFKEEWKKHCKFGFAMAFLILRVMLSSKEEVLNIEDVNFDNLEKTRSRRVPIKLQDEYIRRLRILADHFVRNDFL